MITGIGIASQQANEYSRILILCVNLVFVRTKALLAAKAVRNFSSTLQTELAILRMFCCFDVRVTKTSHTKIKVEPTATKSKIPLRLWVNFLKNQNLVLTNIKFVI